MSFDNINPEILAKAKDCKSPEEMLALAKEAGYVLTDEELDAVSGGVDDPENSDWCSSYCGDRCPDLCFNFCLKHI